MSQQVNGGLTERQAGPTMWPIEIAI